MEKFLNYLNQMPSDLRHETLMRTVCVSNRYLITSFSMVDFNVYDLKRNCLLCSHAENIDVAEDLSLRIEINNKTKFFVGEQQERPLAAGQTIYVYGTVYSICEQDESPYDVCAQGELTDGVCKQDIIRNLYGFPGRLIDKKVDYVKRLSEDYYAHCSQGRAYFRNNNHEVLVTSVWDPKFPAFPAYFPYGFIADNRIFQDESGCPIVCGKIYDLNGNLIDSNLSKIVYAGDYYFYQKGIFMIARNAKHEIVKKEAGRWQVYPNGIVCVEQLHDRCRCFYDKNLKLLAKITDSQDIHFYPDGSFKIKSDGKVTMYTADGMPSVKNADEIFKLQSYAYVVQKGKTISYYDPSGNLCFSFKEGDKYRVYNSPNANCFIAYHDKKYTLYTNDKKLIDDNIRICENNEPEKGWYIYETNGKKNLLSPLGKKVICGYDEIVKLPGRVFLGINRRPQYTEDLYSEDGRLLIRDFHGIDYGGTGKYILPKGDSFEVRDFN